MISRTCLNGIRRLHCTVFVVLLAILPGVARSQANVPDALSAVAQEALNKGILAAKVPDYPLALRFFEAARKAAPQASVVFLNLGLAESRVPGRELRAMAWFGAYLAANPAAPNALAVQEQIDALDVKSQSNISRLIKSVQDAASQISGVEQSIPLANTATLWRESGDMAAALKAANLIQDAAYKGVTLSSLAFWQARSGDLAGAQKTADLIQDTRYKSSALISISEFKIQGGDSAGARVTLAAALKSADLIDRERQFGILSSAYIKSKTHSEIAATQALAGDIAGAQATVGLVREASHQPAALASIAKAQVKVGDIAGAQKSVESAQRVVALIDHAYTKNIAQEYIKVAQAAIANAANANRQSAPSTQPDVQPVISVSDWLKKLDDDDDKSDCPLNTEPFLDLAGHLRSLPKSDSATNVFDGLRETAVKIVGAQNIISEMLKQQAQK